MDIMHPTPACTRPELHGSACRVRVERRAPFIIKYANTNWLRELGYHAQDEVAGRSLRICYGPKTPKPDIAILIRNCAGAGLDSTVLYTKSGEEKRLWTRAFAVKSVDGTKECMLEMYDLDVQPSFAKPGNEYPNVTISPTAPHKVLQVNVAFLAFFGCTVSECSANGIEALFGKKTDRKAWRRFLRAGSSGRSKATQTVVRSANQQEVPIAVEVSPIFSKSNFSRTKKVEGLALTFIEEASLSHGLRRVNGRLPRTSVSGANSDGEPHDEEVEDLGFSTSSSEYESDEESDRQDTAQFQEAVKPPRGANAQIEALNFIQMLRFDSPRIIETL